ncbi:MAG: SusC/RagA family TonB-linked outer membrane protein [Flavobacteriaceae bacterium]|nr:SusC/RagA family TonB-linked outer membrane protein [Flavobacteriaceae bacterium]
MKTKLSGILTLLLAFVVQITFAQDRTITGTVSDETGPLPGVSVLIEGTSTGTETDFDGNYTIETNQGDVLRFSFVGMTTMSRTIGSDNIINITMVSDDNTLDEVVVTAFGIKREKQALGYAVSTVKEDMLEQRADGDIGRVLAGKASGINIQSQSGMSGSGTSILIRGMNSFSGSNQPLFVVNGVPFSSGTNAQGDFVDGNNGSSRFLDLDPNNIESVSILKGLAAATLYGTDGRNGVILITTKSGAGTGGSAKKNEVTVMTSLFINEVASLPDYQNEYGGGFDQAFGWFFSNWGPSFAEGGPGGWGNSSAFDANGTLPHPYSTASLATGVPQAFPEFANARVDWRPYDSVKNFFRKGIVSNINVNARGASKSGDVTYNVNYGNLSDEGFTPGNKLIRNNFSVGGRAKLSNKLSINSNLNYTKTSFKTPPVAASTGSNVGGENASIFGNLFYTPRSVDMLGLPFQNPITGESVYYRQNNSIQHPLWTINNTGNIQDTFRTYGNISANYEINDNLTATYNYGLDVYNENNTNFANKGGKTGSIANQSGVYETWTNTNTIDDHNFILNGDYDITDRIDVNFTVGATSRREVFDRNGVRSTGQQVFGVLRHFNFAAQDEIQNYEERNTLGAYGTASFGFDNFLYATLSGRKDWVSNLAEANRSIFYPSADIAFIPTKAFEALKGSETLNYLKLRAGYGTSSNFPRGYPISSTLILDTQYFQDDAGVDVVTNTTGRVLGNTNLKPETIAELEFGVEARLFKNRLTLDASYYTRTTNDLIIERPLGPETGYTRTTTNIGEVQNEGWELDLGIDIIRNDDDGFNWNANMNFFTNEAIVTDLGLDTDIVVYSGFSNGGNAAIKGESILTMVGTAVDRDDAGNFRVNSAGSYVEKQGNNIIGDANPDFNFNLSNSMSYKNFSFNFLFTWVEGGDVLSWTTATLLGRGVVSEEGVDRANSFILPGVNPAGQPNTTQINNSTFYFSNVLYGPDELKVYDATVFRLQELSLSYSLPSKFLDNSPIGALSLTFSGYNMWFFAPNIPENVNFDPQLAGLGVGNGRGFEFQNAPSGKRYGMSIKISF